MPLTTCPSVALRQAETLAVPDRASADRESGQWAFRGLDLGSRDDLATRPYGLRVRSRLLARQGDVGTAFALAGQVDGRARTAQHPRDQSDAAAALASAVTSLREASTPCHSARGLLDYAEHRAGQDDADGAPAAGGETRGIAEYLGCQLLPDQAEDLAPAQSRMRA